LSVEFPETGFQGGQIVMYAEDGLEFPEALKGSPRLAFEARGKDFESVATFFYSDAEFVQGRHILLRPEV
jgi:hypothetical protein